MARTPPRADDFDHETGTGNADLIAANRAEIAAAGGCIPFARFMELALYHPDWGYYLSPVRRPGRPGDFLTAPETHPFFGITLARQIAECWERLDRPAPFVVREYGSGIGALAWDVIAGLSKETPQCRAVLQYRLVETNPHRLAQALAGFAEGGLGDVVRAEEIPRDADPEPITGVMLANEVADAFPVHRLIWRGGRLREGWVVWAGDRFAEEEGDLSQEAAAGDPEGMLRDHGISLVE
jgi:SAM-dependent MidA family methyltransferase